MYDFVLWTTFAFFPVPFIDHCYVSLYVQHVHSEEENTYVITTVCNMACVIKYFPPAQDDFVPFS